MLQRLCTSICTSIRCRYSAEKFSGMGALKSVLPGNWDKGTSSTFPSSQNVKKITKQEEKECYARRGGEKKREK